MQRDKNKVFCDTQMNNRPFISFVVPVYNVEKFISECVNSFISQTDPDWELVLVDDGSTDASFSICKRFAQTDNRIKAVSISNGGPSRAKNYGLNLITGTYVAFVDSDDWISPSYVEIIRKNIFDYDVVFFGLEKIFPDFTVEHIPVQMASCQECGCSTILCHLMENDDKFKFFGFNVLKIFKSKIIQEKELYFDERLSNSEDFAFMLSYVPFVNSISVIPQKLYFYRFLSTSLSHSKKRFQNFSLVANVFFEKSLIIQKKYPKLAEIFLNEAFNRRIAAITEIIRLKKWNKLNETLLLLLDDMKKWGKQIVIPKHLEICLKFRFLFLQKFFLLMMILFDSFFRRMKKKLVVLYEKHLVKIFLPLASKFELHCFGIVSKF